MLVPVSVFEYFSPRFFKPSPSKPSLRPLPLCTISSHFFLRFCQSPLRASSTLKGGTMNCSLRLACAVYVCDTFSVGVKPNCDISSIMSPSSKSSWEISHSASSEVLLSASLNAFIWSGVRSSAIMQGMSLIPSLYAAFNLVCPATISLSLSMTMGTLKPNSLMLAATASTAWSFLRGLRLYGFNSSMGLITICTLISPCPSSTRRRPLASGAHRVLRVNENPALYRTRFSRFSLEV